MDERREKSIFRILPSYVWQLEKFTLNSVDCTLSVVKGGGGGWWTGVGSQAVDSQRAIAQNVIIAYSL